MTSLPSRADAFAPPPYRWTQGAAVTLARGLARTFCSLEVTGRENLAGPEPILLCANHTSHADTFALATAAGSAATRLVFLGAHDYFSKFRWRRALLQRVICLVDFNRGSSIAAAKGNLAMLSACREAGRIVVLFPEGTRAADGVMAPFKQGAAAFADKLGLRVVPCRIEGAYAILPKGRWLPRPAPLRVTFGVPMAIPAATHHETGAERSTRYAAFTTEIQSRVARLGRTPGLGSPVLSS